MSAMKIERSGGGEESPPDRSDRGIRLLTRHELAEALKISVRTVDRMLACEEVTPVRLRGKLVRFHLRDVVASLKGGKRKFGRRAAVTTQNAQTLKAES